MTFILKNITFSDLSFGFKFLFFYSGPDVLTSDKQTEEKQEAVKSELKNVRLLTGRSKTLNLNI